MLEIVSTVAKTLRSAFGSRQDLVLENLALRHQLAVLTRSEGRPRFRQGELLKLGIEISERTVSRYMPEQRKPPSQSWRTSLKNHMGDLVSIDSFTAPTVCGHPGT